MKCILLREVVVEMNGCWRSRAIELALGRMGTVQVFWATKALRSSALGWETVLDVGNSKPVSTGWPIMRSSVGLTESIANMVIVLEPDFILDQYIIQSKLLYCTYVSDV